MLCARHCDRICIRRNINRVIRILGAICTRDRRITDICVRSYRNLQARCRIRTIQYCIGNISNSSRADHYSPRSRRHILARRTQRKRLIPIREAIGSDVRITCRRTSI